MTTCTRRLTFCAGHRVAGHENKCAHLHGHNYVVFVTAEADALDDLGRVVDFSVIKERVGAWIESNWDHGFILWAGDEEALGAVRNWSQSINQKIYELPDNPTAENLARHLLNVASRLLADTGVRVVRVVVWETENCCAEATA